MTKDRIIWVFAPRLIARLLGMPLACAMRFA